MPTIPPTNPPRIPQPSSSELSPNSIGAEPPATMPIVAINEIGPFLICPVYYLRFVFFFALDVGPGTSFVCCALPFGQLDKRRTPMNMCIHRVFFTVYNCARHDGGCQTLLQFFACFWRKDNSGLLYLLYVSSFECSHNDIKASINSAHNYRYRVLPNGILVLTYGPVLMVSAEWTVCSP